MREERLAMRILPRLRRLYGDRAEECGRKVLALADMCRQRDDQIDLNLAEPDVPVQMRLFRFSVQIALPRDGTAAHACYIGVACTWKPKSLECLTFCTTRSREPLPIRGRWSIIEVDLLMRTGLSPVSKSTSG